MYMSNQRSYCKLMTLAMIFLLIFCSGDIETHSGLNKNTKASFCHWNLNGIAAQNFSKLSLLQVMVTTHEYDIMYLRKRFLFLHLTRLMTELILKDTIF